MEGGSQLCGSVLTALLLYKRPKVCGTEDPAQVLSNHVPQQPKIPGYATEVKKDLFKEGLSSISDDLFSVGIQSVDRKISFVKMSLEHNDEWENSIY